jgi:hypothetical protein
MPYSQELPVSARSIAGASVARSLVPRSVAGGNSVWQTPRKLASYGSDHGVLSVGVDQRCNFLSYRNLEDLTDEDRM